MVIYLDLVIISTFIVNTLIIEGINTIFNEKISIIRAILSGILAVLLLFIYLYPIGKITYIRYLLGIPLGIIAFKKTTIKNLIIKIIFYYLFNLALIGSLQIFKIKSISFVIISTILIIILGILTSFRNHYELEVIISKRKYHALYDSGNMSYYNNKPIIYLDEKYKNQNFTFIDTQLINTIHTSQLINIYIGPEILINKTKHQVYYAFIKLNEYDLILHKDIGGIRCLNY